LGPRFKSNAPLGCARYRASVRESPRASRAIARLPTAEASARPAWEGCAHAGVDRRSLAGGAVDGS
jgi:hypothetical protein